MLALTDPWCWRDHLINTHTHTHTHIHTRIVGPVVAGSKEVHLGLCYALLVLVQRKIGRHGGLVGGGGAEGRKENLHTGGTTVA